MSGITEASDSPRGEEMATRRGYDRSARPTLYDRHGRPWTDQAGPRRPGPTVPYAAGLVWELILMVGLIVVVIVLASMVEPDISAYR